MTRQETKAQAADARYRATMEDWRTRAVSYREAGHGFFVMQLALGGSQAGFVQGSLVGGVDPAGILKIVEDAGWSLVDCGYVYMTMREQSHLLTDSATIQGTIVGIYTFRRT